jgi:primary-amine oxidase
MVVPYGDPARTWSFRNAFDVGEYGLGRSAHMLDPLLDVPAHATFLDAHFADDLGEPLTIPRAIAVYERDGGLLWKHTDMNTRDSDGRRARELVVTFTTTIGNYDYGVDWVFHQDGTLAVEVFLTGILLAKGTAAEKNPCDGECLRLVAPRILAPNHQHFFNFRLDLDVDGAADNTPVQADVAALPASADNPDRNAFDVTLTRLERESRAARDLSPATARKWKVVSTTRKNALGHPTGYALMTGETATPYLDAGSPIRRRARFLDHAVWFTRYHDAEQSAAGEYPNQAGGGEGLERFVADDEPLEGQDVVLWYTFGVTHVPRPEEWPIMNAHRAGFSLVPVHFFARNPALSVPAVPRGAIRDALRRPSP